MVANIVQSIVCIGFGPGQDLNVGRKNGISHPMKWVGQSTFLPEKPPLGWVGLKKLIHRTIGAMNVTPGDSMHFG